MARITFLNYTNFEIVPTPLVVIKGFFNSENNSDYNCTCTCKEISMKTYIIEVKGQSVTKSEMPTKTVNSNFTVLAELCPGKNVIDFQFVRQCCTIECEENQQNQLNLIYEPNSNDVFVQPLLVYCPNDNGKPLLRADTGKDTEIRKISLALQLVQTYYSDQFPKFRLQRKSFRCLTTTERSPEIPVLFELKTSQEKLAELTTEEVWRLLAKELMMRPTVWREKCKYVAFILSPWKNCLDVDTAKSKLELSSRACDLAMGTGGLAIMPLSFTSTWPESISNVFCAVDNSEPRDDIHFKFFGANTTAGKIYSATMGCLAHEIGHLFDLGHTNKGIMGQDYHNYEVSLHPKLAQSGIRNVDMDSQSGRGKQKDFVLEVPTFSRSSAVLLFFHRGFQPERKPLSTSTTFEFKNNIIHSSIGISSIELRGTCTGDVLKGWTYDTEVKVFKFPLTKKEIPAVYTDHEVQIVAQDLEGNILKTTANVGSIPQTSFTKLRH